MLTSKSGFDLRNDRRLGAWVYLARAKAGLIFGITDGLKLGFICHEQKLGLIFGMTDGLKFGFNWHEQRLGLIFGMKDGLKLGVLWHEQSPSSPPSVRDFNHQKSL